MVNTFEKHVAEANKFIKSLAISLGDADNPDLAVRVTKAIFKALRQRITPEQSLHIVSQLPLILKGLYVDGWELSQRTDNTKTWEQFLEDLRNTAWPSSSRDFADDDHAREIVSKFFGVLTSYVSEGELADLKSQLPPVIAEVIA